MNKFSVLYDHVCQRASRSLMEALKPFDGIDTVAAHGGYDPVYLEEVGRPVVPPITLSSTFQQLSPGIAKYDYSRSGNFSRECLEKCIASLEDGHDCCVFSSGLAALGTLIQILSSNDHIVAFDDLYGGNGRYLRQLASKSGITSTFVDMRDLKLFQQALQKNTRLVLIESPSNPSMRLVDISAVASITHKFNKEIIVVVDNTFMSSYFQRPLDHGADVVLHSLTKYMNGHSDLVMGALVTRNQSELHKQLRFIQYAAGAVPSPFDCFLCLRGLRTLPIRMKTHMQNGLIVAMMLEKHPMVEKVLHPGLESFPQSDIIVKQMRGFSGMITVYLRCTGEQTKTFTTNLKLFTLAESLGGYESLIEIPSIMTHASVPAEVREANGITENMLRLSVGLEDPKDLSLDLYEALDKLDKDSKPI
ncbi:putative cystathionine beta-lyase [Schistosoma mansoni]|uniref:putative cystathionine beta-lyase n=1 Tax=Schistosoma mansoni TaxID=6183 RepID=UPI0001A62ADF|nr:putative cystathionine beta-lyase [Schistosoma mansoni]|eukprot:XP_018648715.1 putative cystathionine beta-lyase [Schistosoma mansoni]